MKKNITITLWSDLRVPQSTRGESIAENNTASTSIIEATGFAIDEFGQVELVALPKTFENLQQLPNCGEL